jgi:D-arabinose 1-dehydrogenase-like Zn-dependent alcohol dehydrogenase
LIKVAACGVCRTDLHVVDGELPHPKPNVIPGHEVVGTVAAISRRVDSFTLGGKPISLREGTLTGATASSTGTLRRQKTTR